MPKSVYKIDEFSGGLVTHQSPRDIPDEALSVAQNIMVDIKGQIRLMGRAQIHPDFGGLSIDKGVVNPGYGLFALHHDYSFTPHLLLSSIANTSTIPGTSPSVYKKTATTTTNHNLDTGSVIRIYNSNSATFDGIYNIEKTGATTFLFSSLSNSADTDGDAGYVATTPGAFRSLFLDDNGTIKIFPEYADIIEGWVQNNFATTLALGANYGKLSSVSADYPENWDTARLTYSFHNGALRISNANHNDPTSLADLDKYDWPTWLGYLDDKFFTDADGADILGTIEWKPQWYQTLAHPMNPYEWNTLRNFYNNHDSGGWSIDDLDTAGTAGTNGRAQQCFIYAYKAGGGALESTKTKFEGFHHDVDINSNVSGDESMSILPGQFGVRMWTDTAYEAQGNWSAGTMYKFGYSYYYDEDANSATSQESEIMPMGTWNAAQTNPSNSYLNTHAIDGCLNLAAAGNDSEGNASAFNPQDDVAVEMQVYLNTGGAYNDANPEADTGTSGNTGSPMFSFWPPRVKGIRLWVIGHVDLAGAAGKITYVQKPLLTLEIDFKLGVRNSVQGEFAKWEALGAVTLKPDGTPAAEDNIVTHSTLIHAEEPTETYSTIAEYEADRAYGAIKGKTDTIVNNCRYVGNVIVDEGVSGSPHNVFDSTKRKLVTKSDHVFKSQPFKPDIFLKEDVITVGEENDGEEVVKVDSLGSQLLVWKENTLYVYDVAEFKEILVQTYKHMGLLHPHAVTKVEKGIAWINKNGLYMYDGENLGNAISGKILPKDWADFVGKDANLGYIPINKQIVVFQSGVGNDSSGDVYVFDVQTDSVTYGDNVLSPLAKSNTVSNYDGSLMFAGPKLDDVHEINTHQISGSSPGSLGRWVLKGLGDDMAFTNTKLTIKSTDITNTFSGQSMGVGNTTIDYIINKINMKCGVGVFTFEANYDLGTLAIIWPITSASNGTYNAVTLAGDLVVTNPPVFPTSIEQTVLTTNYLSMLDGDNYEENHPQSTGYPMTFNGETHETTGLRAIGMSAGGQATGNRSANSPIDVNMLKEFGQFIVSDVSGSDHILAADEALYTVENSVALSNGSETPYDILTNEVGNNYINTKGPNWSSFNFSTTISQPTICNVSLPVLWVDTSFAGDTPFAYVYFSDPSIAKYFYAGLTFSFTSEDIDSFDTLVCLNSEVIDYGDRKVGRLIVEGIIGSSGNSGYDHTTSAFRTVDIDFTHSGTNNDYTTSGIGVDNVEIPNNDGGKQYYIVPKFNHTAGNADDLVTYTISVSGNDGNSYQFQRTRAADEYLYATMLALKHDMEDANSSQTAWRQSSNFSDTTSFIMPTVTLNVDFHASNNTITDNSKTLRNYAQLLDTDCAFDITNAADSTNNRTFLVGTFVQGTSSDVITIDTTADTLSSADPSDIVASVAATQNNDEVTIRFHSLYMTETLDKPYELFANSGVYSGAQIYNFTNAVNTDLVNTPKFSTKEIDLGAPGVRKNLIKMYVTVKNADNLKIDYTLNGESRIYSLRPSSGNAETISNTTSEYKTFELVPEYGADQESRNGFYSIQFNFSTSFPQSNFNLNDISLVYRSVGVR